MQVMLQIVYIVERERSKESKRKVESISDMSHMDEDQRRLDEDMGWATIVICSCENSCQVEVG